jgi:hypothetical protein
LIGDRDIGIARAGYIIAANIENKQPSNAARGIIAYDTTSRCIGGASRLG